VAIAAEAKHLGRPAATKDLTNRWSQPLAEKKITKVKLESRKLKRKLAVASGGLSSVSLDDAAEN